MIIVHLKHEHDRPGFRILFPPIQFHDSKLKAARDEESVRRSERMDMMKATVKELSPTEWLRPGRIFPGEGEVLWDITCYSPETVRVATTTP